jgi:anti-sigma B factor antagonist
METGDFGIDVDTAGEATVVVVTGELDLATAPKLRAALADLSGAVRLDLGAVTFLDSSAISVLVEAHQRLAESGNGGLVLHSLAGQTRRVLEIAGLEDFFELSDEPAPGA